MTRCAVTESTLLDGLPWTEVPIERRPSRVGRRFDLGEELGRGAMGVVYRGFDLDERRPVAVKLSLHQGERPLERARREVRAAERIGAHPGVVRLVAHGDHDGRPWLAFDLVRGARPLDVAFLNADRERRLRWVRDAGLALAKAHARGVVHRDVKPENVLVDARDRAWVIDFGLACIDDPSPQRRMLGTPRYMSPEQILGAPVTPATDVWGLGCLLHVALTHAPPYAQDDIPTLYKTIVRGRAPRPRALDATIPRALDDLVADCLSRDPAVRPRDGGAFARRLERCSLEGGLWNGVARRLLEAWG